MRAVGQPDRRRAAADLLHRDAVLEIAEPGAAVLLLHRDAVQAELADLGPQMARELVGLVDLGRQRRNLVGGEAAHARAQLVGRLAEIEIQGREIVGDHGRVSPCRLRSLASARAAPRQGVLRGPPGRRHFTRGPSGTHSASRNRKRDATWKARTPLAPTAVPWPPILIVAALALGMLLGRNFPLAWPGMDDLPARIIGYGFGIAGIALIAWGFLTLQRAGTTILPNKRADRLVTEGAFRFRRNPIYMGEVLVFLGLAEFTHNIWFAILAPLLAVAVVCARHPARGAASGDPFRASLSRL